MTRNLGDLDVGDEFTWKGIAITAIFGLIGHTGCIVFLAHYGAAKDAKVVGWWVVPSVLGLLIGPPCTLLLARQLQLRWQRRQESLAGCLLIALFVVLLPLTIMSIIIDTINGLKWVGAGALVGLFLWVYTIREWNLYRVPSGEYVDDAVSGGSFFTFAVLVTLSAMVASNLYCAYRLGMGSPP